MSNVESNAFCRGAASSGGRRARDYLSSLSRADITAGGNSTAAGGGGERGGSGGGNETLSVANSSPLTLSNEDLSSTRSMSPRFNSTLIDGGQNGGGHTAAGHQNGK